MSLYYQTRNVTACLLTVLACGPALLATSAGAAGQAGKMGTHESSINTNQDDAFFSGRMSLGWLNGESNENVYAADGGRKLSELKWGLDNVLMLGLGGSVAPLSWLKINTDVWLKVSNGDGKMDDYDYVFTSSQYSDWSHHDNVDLTTGLMFDINAEFIFYRWQGSKFFGIGGFKHDNWKWEASGGNYIYTTSSLYDTVGSFADGEKIITYEQNFNTPYLGIGFSANLNPTPITLSGRVIGSTLVQADDKDQHHLRNLVFEEEFDSGTMVAFDLNGAYHFTRNFSLMLSYQFQKYEEMKGSTTVTDLTTGGVTKYSGDVAGMDQNSNMVSATFVVSF